jgi:lipopolysaccharide transport system permease protein
MAVLMVFYRIAPPLAVLLLPLWLVLLLLLAMGFGLIAGALMVSYRDVQYIIPVLIPFFLYASPVGYAASNVPAKFRMLYSLNPLSGLLDAFHWSLLGGSDFHLAPIAYSAVISVTVFLIGAVVFKRMERRFADVI